MFLQETYAIKDAIYYNSNTISSTTILSIPNIPTNFKASFNINRSSSSTAVLEIGSDADNNIFGGNIGTSGYIGAYVRVNGNYERYDVQDRVYGTGTTPTEFAYEDGVITVKANNVTRTVTSTTITARNWQRITIGGNGTVSELLIMPL